ncbi:MAG: alpha/beta hydrolase [Pseudomonadota bacterium]
MPSLRSRLFVFALRFRLWLKSRRGGPEVITEDTSIAELRARVEKSAGMFGKLAPGFTIEPVDIEGLNAEWLRPPAAAGDKALLYFHGGGLVVGSARSHRNIVQKFAGACGVPALVFDYGLAPEQPFPRALEDSLRAYRHLLDGGLAPQDIVFMGDSGGGNLCLSILLACQRDGLPLPAAVVALSPWTDLTNSGASYQENLERDHLTWRNSAAVFARYYAGEHALDDPLVSPLHGDLRGLPPLLLFAGSDELMRDDSVRFADKARAAGVDVTLHLGEGLFHCYPACAGLFPEATQALQVIARFVQGYLGLESASEPRKRSAA